MSTVPTTGKQLRSLVSAEGQLELSLVDVAVPVPTGTEVLIRVEASPINPSDLGLLIAGADVSAMTRAANGGATTAPIDPSILKTLSGRYGQSMAVGNEGAGTVVAAGDSPAAQALLGRTVAVAGGSMYAEYRVVDASACLVLPEGTPASAGASSFVNPMTALGMVETMRMEGHSALVHTAAASNLGQMLVKLCQEENVPLVNVVRSPAQEATLRALGAQYVCDSSKPTFMSELVAAVTATKATLGFDATGGGNLASQLLTAMEQAAIANSTEYSRYGSTTFKQVYIYGGLERSVTTLSRSFGFSWGIGGWLLTPFLIKLGGEGINRLRQRVADGITTTFASHYSRTITLDEALDPANVAVYARQATGEKFLITPHG